MKLFLGADRHCTVAACCCAINHHRNRLSGHIGSVHMKIQTVVTFSVGGQGRSRLEMAMAG